jgi:hypothetical protein
MRVRSRSGRIYTLLLLALLSALLVTIFYRHVPKKIAEITETKHKIDIVKPFLFSEENSLKEWEEKIFKGKVVYRVEKDKDLSYVRATSDKAASALYYKIKLDAKTARPYASWKWKAGKFPVKNTRESLEDKNADDFAARVYVIFPAVFFTNSRVLEYIWAESLPVGSTGTSSYSKNIKLIVLESGPRDEWVSEDRDIRADYVMMFGRMPEYDIGAIAFMTNAENTGTSADAMYDEIKVGYIEGDKL